MPVACDTSETQTDHELAQNVGSKLRLARSARIVVALCLPVRIPRLEHAVIDLACELVVPWGQLLASGRVLLLRENAKSDGRPEENCLIDVRSCCFC